MHACNAIHNGQHFVNWQAARGSNEGIIDGKHIVMTLLLPAPIRKSMRPNKNQCCRSTNVMRMRGDGSMEVQLSPFHRRKRSLQGFAHLHGVEATRCHEEYNIKNWTICSWTSSQISLSRVEVVLKSQVKKWKSPEMYILATLCTEDEFHRMSKPCSKEYLCFPWLMQTLWAPVNCTLD
jgi:hypothetical protein